MASVRRETMLEDTLFENSELKKKIEKLEDKIRKQEDKIKSLETSKDKYKREAAAAKGLKVREDNFDENRQTKYSSIRAKYGIQDPSAPSPFAMCSKYRITLFKPLELTF
ncbi:unnamed protein product [Oikopleura dioica]|uniref:Uncharacterized protein n=1 Tax=Oikopleura dioica TaxID=34765 RepID=E4YXX5_OIKDI|nr:unnamed protein product [Oikopleura dioica]